VLVVIAPRKPHGPPIFKISVWHPFTAWTWWMSNDMLVKTSKLSVARVPQVGSARGQTPALSRFSDNFKNVTDAGANISSIVAAHSECADRM
jgi:hypothetical protein